MKLKQFFKNFYGNIKEGVLRFPVAFICTILFFAVSSIDIVFNVYNSDLVISLLLTFALTAVFSVFLKTLQEYINEHIGGVIRTILSVLAAVICFVLTNIYIDSLYMVMAYTGIIIANFCFIFFVIMHGENRDLAFPRIVSSLIFAGAICTVLSAGLSICIAAFQFLIYTWGNIYKLYLVVNLFVWVVCFVNIFLSLIPKKDVPVQQSKMFRAFVLFAGLPLYMLLIVILLVYLAKIVVTWNMPVGEINWFASFASLFFIFFLLSVMQYKEKIAKLYVKFGGYFLAPVLVMQAIAVFERINAYGLTTPRTVSLVLIIISILFIVGSLVVPKHLNKIALASGIIVLIVTITPLNVIDMPIHSQTNLLKSVLVANNMLKDGTVTPDPDISEADKEKILSAYGYLRYDAKNTPDFIPGKNKSTLEIFGFENTGDSSHYEYCTFRAKESADITNYNTILKVNDNDDIVKFEHKGKKYEVDLKDIAENLYAEYGTEGYDLDLYKIDEDTALYLTNLSFRVEDGVIAYCYFDGFVLLKN